MATSDDDDTTPTTAEITRWLTDSRRPPNWAALLVGLPWRYIRPLVTIAATTANHPMVALKIAASYSRDDAFRAAAVAHLRALNVATPNRAQRRAAAKQTRRRR